ncbi:MAG TPA: YceI family protein [Chthoniobacterales bacterium]|nr:YceI family protein [Chthoniobacterales bacterium]
MRAICLVLVSLLALARVAPAAETFRIDPAHSTIAFDVRQMLGTAKGRFSRFSGTILVDRDHPERSSVTVQIAAASIDTGIAKRDDHLRSELFEVAKYSEITFKSRRVKQTGANSGEIVGDLTMHGVTREISLNVQLLANPIPRWRATTAPLRRSQFGLAFSKSVETVSMISDEVAVEIEIAAN